MEIVDPAQKRTIQKFYFAGWPTASQITIDSQKTSYRYDYRFRPINVQTDRRFGKLLGQKTVDVSNRLFYSEDSYGRREYTDFRAQNNLIRRVSGTQEDFSLADNRAVLKLDRDQSPNAPLAFVPEFAKKIRTGTHQALLLKELALPSIRRHSDVIQDQKIIVVLKHRTSEMLSKGTREPAAGKTGRGSALTVFRNWPINRYGQAPMPDVSILLNPTLTG